MTPSAARGAGAGPLRAPGDPPLFLRELIDSDTAGRRVLDAGCGPGLVALRRRGPISLVIGFDIKFPPGPPARARARRRSFRADLGAAAAPRRALRPHGRATTCSSTSTAARRVLRRAGARDPAAAGRSTSRCRARRRSTTGSIASPATSRSTRCSSSQQADRAPAALRPRDAARPASTRAASSSRRWRACRPGFSWMNDRAHQAAAGPVHRRARARCIAPTGVDLARDANFVMTLPAKTGAARARRAPRDPRVPRVRRAQRARSATTPWPERWTCPWCGKPNRSGRPR